MNENLHPVICDYIFISSFEVKTNKETNEIYAVKFLQHTDVDFYSCIRREIILLSKCDHPSIVKFIGFSKSGFNKSTLEEPTILMNFAPRMSLDQILKKNYLEQTVSLKIIIGISSALAEMFKHNIVHRNLNPNNIFLNENLEPIICDLGCSRKNDMSFDCETYTYQAPEVLINHPIYTYKVDAYAFGMILYQIISRNIYLNENKSFCMSKLMNWKMSKNSIYYFSHHFLCLS